MNYVDECNALKSFMADIAQQNTKLGDAIERAATSGLSKEAVKILTDFTQDLLGVQERSKLSPRDAEIWAQGLLAGHPSLMTIKQDHGILRDIFDIATRQKLSITPILIPLGPNEMLPIPGSTKYQFVPNEFDVE
jgi:hypothetical protein